MAEQLANNASTTLNGSIDNAVTSVVVADGTVFPSVGNFRLLCEGELMLCTARSGNTLTVTRGAEFSPAMAHAAGLPIELIYTKGSFNQMIADYEQVGPYASRPAAPRKGTLYTATDLINCQWLYDGSAWSLIKPIVAQPVDLSGWTAGNHGTSTWTNKNGIVEVSINSASNSNIRGYIKTATGTAITIGVAPVAYGEGSFTWYLGFRDSVSSRVIVCSLSGGTAGTWSVEQWNTLTSLNASLINGVHVFQNAKFMRAENDGTNLKFSYSFDGKNFTQVYSQAKATWLTNNQSQVCLFVYHSVGYPVASNYFFHLLSVKET